MLNGEQPIDFGTLMGPVAKVLLGDPNVKLSRNTELRWGSKGSMSVDLDKGVWSDHEAGSIGGGVLDLIMREQRCDKPSAMSWLRDNGFIESQHIAPVIRHPLANRVPLAAAAAHTFYDYFDEDGVLAYRVERVGKDARVPFLHHGPDGKGGFHCKTGCMDGVKRLPYRLPALMAAPVEKTVYLCEGEKDADRLASLGLVATTNSGGANKFKDLAPYFAGRRVAIVEDNDEPGRKHSADVRGKLSGVAKEIVILRFPNLPEHGDVSDWLDLGGSENELAALVAKLFLAQKPDDPIGQMFTVADTAGIEPNERRWIVDQLLPVGAVTTMFGDGGVGKTLCAMQFGTAVEQGKPIFGFETSKTSVLGFFCEDDQEELERRFSAICKVDGIAQSNVKLFGYQSRFGRESLLGVFNAVGEYESSALLKAITAMAIERGVRFIILDNILHLFAGNINDPTLVTRFVARLNKLALDIDGAVLLLGHTAKAAGSTFAGTMAWSNASRSRLFFGRPGDLDQPVIKMEDTALVNPDARIIARLKANYAPISDPMELMWHHGAFIRPTDAPADARSHFAESAKAVQQNERFLYCLAKATAEARATSASCNASTYAPRMFAKMTDGRGIGQRGFEAAMERLFGLGRIKADQQLWRRGNSSWVYGLAEVKNPPQSVSHAGHAGSSESGGNAATSVPSGVSLYTTYIDDTAHGAAVSSPAESSAAELTDEPIEGWD